MPSVYDLLPNATGQGQPPILYGEVAPPAPMAFSDPLYVTLPDWNTSYAFQVPDWASCHGDALPEVGAAVLVVKDSRGQWRVPWWDGRMVFGTQSSLTYYLTPTASDVGGYDQQVATPYPSPTTTIYALSTSGQVVRNFATTPLVPDLAFLPAGQFECHVHAAQISGAASARLYAEFWEVDAAGVDVAKIGVTQTSPPLSASLVEYRLFFIAPNVYAFSSTTSRIVCRLRAIVGGGSASITLAVGGVTDSHVVVPVGASLLDGNFIPANHRYDTGVSPSLQLESSVQVGGEFTSSPLVLPWSNLTNTSNVVPVGGLYDGFYAAGCGWRYSVTDGAPATATIVIHNLRASGASAAGWRGTFHYYPNG